MAGGGSGGHITPLLSLGHALKQKSPRAQVFYIGLGGEKLEGLDERLKIFDGIYRVSSGKLRRYHGQHLISEILDVKTLALNFIDSFKVGFGYLQAKRLLRRLQPDVVLSKGGYAALPTGLAAHSLKIPLVTHDSDSTPGLTNRLIGKHAALHATAYPADNYLDYYPAHTIRYSGLPLDERLRPVNSAIQLQYKKRLGIPPKSYVLLVTGGGLGSLNLNNKTIALSKKFLSESDNYLIHFCGTQHVAHVESSYKQVLETNQLSRVTVLGFSAELYIYTGAADAVVTRAGASTLAELAAQRKACIVIPADFLSGGHQTKNIADWHSKQAILQAKDDITPQNLLSLINRLKQNHHLRNELGQNLGSLIRTDGAEQLADIILGFKK